MYTLSVSLFGKFSVQCNETRLDGFEAFKVQELLSYLLLGRDQAHHREALANLLWENIPTTQSKRYLSKALWQLQMALDTQLHFINGRMLLVEPDWIQLESNDDLWFDVDIFERAFNLVREIPGRQLNELELQSLVDTVELYRGALLEGWYQPWCLYERERLEHIYVLMLDKLMDYFEAYGRYETSLIYGARLLRQDQARESTHRRIMRLYYLAGDRTESLRQYERCVAILKDELDVSPAEQTKSLFEKIKGDCLIPLPAFGALPTLSGKKPYTKKKMIEHFEQIQATLTNTQFQIQREIEAIKMLLDE